MVRHSSAKRGLGERSIAGSNPVPSAQLICRCDALLQMMHKQTHLDKVRRTFHIQQDFRGR